MEKINCNVIQDILPSIGLTAKVGFMPLFTQTLFFGIAAIVIRQMMAKQEKLL